MAVEKMHTLDAIETGNPFVLESDCRELSLTDAQVERAIQLATEGKGDRVSVTGPGAGYERYVDVDGITVPVCGCDH